MYPIGLSNSTSERWLRRSAGFSLIEVMVSVVIMGILLMAGIPAMSAWIANARVKSMADFYLDGVRLARNGALQKNAASRWVLTTNANGQYDWQVDWCFPVSVSPCDTAGVWSTPTVASANDPNAASPSFSVFHSATSQPPPTQVTITPTPGNALAIYFNSYGWVNTAVQPYLRQLRFDASANFNPNPASPDVRPAAISINLSGISERCDPLAAATDSRACSP